VAVTSSIQFVSATKLSVSQFGKESALGRSFWRVASVDDHISLRLSHSNSVGLSAIYNRAIETATDADILVFVHDDVWIEDYFIADRIRAGLSEFDVIGLAGGQLNRTHLRWGMGHEGSAGWVSHGREALGSIAVFGPTPSPVEVVDGLFIAARRKVLLDAAVRFDEAFTFHFYDLDFCMSARQAELRIGVWPIAVTHQSPGNFEGPEWHAAREVFARKWAPVLQPVVEA